MANEQVGIYNEVERDERVRLENLLRLQNVRYRDEPVVASLISAPIGTTFQVENLPGKTWYEARNNLSSLANCIVAVEAAQQLQAIHQQTNLLVLDRAASNMMVLNPEDISPENVARMRQLDLECTYNTETGQIFATNDQKYLPSEYRLDLSDADSYLAGQIALNLRLALEKALDHLPQVEEINALLKSYGLRPRQRKPLTSLITDIQHVIRI